MGGLSTNFCLEDPCPERALFLMMSKQDRSQIVAEVSVPQICCDSWVVLTNLSSNILQNIRHTNIILYHGKYVDRAAGILYSRVAKVLSRDVTHQ